MSTSRWRWFGLVLVLSIILVAVPIIQAQAPSSSEDATEQTKQPSPTNKQSTASSAQTAQTTQDALAKLHPDLRTVVQNATPQFAGDVDRQAAGTNDPVLVQIMAGVTPEQKLDLTSYFVDGTVLERPAIGKGDTLLKVMIGRVYPANLIKIASLTEVDTILPVVLEQNAEPFPYPADEERQSPERDRDDWDALRADAQQRQASMPAWNQARAYGDGRPDVRPQDWFEVRPEGPHKAEAAWNRGYRGDGVTVGVLDDGIDAAHPDLMGTQKIYSSSVASQYNGWPMVFSPFSMYLYAVDETFETSYIADGYSSIHYVDTSTTPTVSECGAGISCFKYTPLIDIGTANPYAPAGGYTYIFSDTMSKSGAVHVGTHPDNDLRDYVWGEKPAILVSDPNQAGVYDTVYVDLDDDYDFRDEKPLTRADVTDPNTYNDMIAYRDVNGDGLADISGGMVYFIANGNDPVPASDWLYGASCPGFMCPGNGNLVAISGSTFDRYYSHGTQCASNIVGQGRIDGLMPEFVDLGGTPAGGAVQGMAPDAKVVNISDIYLNFESSTIDGYLFAAVGYDAIDQTGYDIKARKAGLEDTDAIQITTNSYGSSDTDNDGWEYKGRLVSQIQRQWAPHLQFLFSTGNGASAYGTTAPPSAITGIGVGASTQFGSTGWDSITETTQINYNDVTPFSNRGPGARGTSGVDVVAGGAFAAGDEELNYYSISTWGEFDGNRSWVSWGGTSRSAPVAGGVLALLYNAYYDEHGVWPTYDQAKALLMSTSTDVNYDTFTQGAGSVNADRGTAVAGGHYGLYADTTAWQPGDYRGTDYPGFAHIAYPNDVFTKAVTVHNPGEEAINASVDDSELKLIRSEDFDFTVTEDMVISETADNFFKAFHYFIPITATAGKDSAWYNIDVPATTDLMVVRQTFPFDEFDVNGDYNWDNRFYLMVYNWKDVNNNGIVWDDKNSNNVVNFVNDPSTAGEQIDGAVELDWDDPFTELDRWEFGRFSYHRPSGNRNEVWVQKPLERMDDGLFIGLRHNPGSTYTGATHLSYRIDFYQKEDVPWLEQSTNSLSVAPGSSETFVVTTSVPSNMPTGMYEAGIQIHDPGMAPTYTADTTVIPVALNVAEQFAGGLQLGGMDSYNYDKDRPYNNGAVRGLFDWSWRPESGDWRFFSVDVPDGAYPDGTQFLLKDEWEDTPTYTTDIDTIVLGPTPSSLGSSGFDTPEPSYYGPYTLDTVAKSPNTNVDEGIWLFDTSSGTNEDWVSGPIQDGLHQFLQHNVLFKGDQIDVVFTKTLGTMETAPTAFTVNSVTDTGTVGTVDVEASVQLQDLQVEAFGLGSPEYILDEPIDHISDDMIEWTDAFVVDHGAKIELSASSSTISDIDLYLYYCGPTGTDPCEQRSSSATSTANEHIEVVLPEDGVWIVGVNNWSGPAGTFNLVRTVIQGYDLSVSNVPTGTIAANTPISFTVDFSRTMTPGESYQGLLLLGPRQAPAVQEIPITINRLGQGYSFSKDVDKAQAFAGEELNYSLEIQNYVSPDEVRLVDTIPTGTEFVSVDNATYDAGNDRIVFHDTVTDTQNVTLTVRVKDDTSSGVTITNTASLTATSLFAGEQQATATTEVIGGADFSTSYKSAPATAKPGESIRYDVHIINSLDETAMVHMTDTIPVSTTFDGLGSFPPPTYLSTLEYVTATNQVIWNGSVAPNQEIVLSYDVVVDSDADWLNRQIITNTATIDWGTSTMDLVADTHVVAPYDVRFPLLFHQP